MFDDLKENIRNLNGLLEIMIYWIEARKKELQPKEEKSL